MKEHRFELDHGTQRAAFVMDGERAPGLVWETGDGESQRLKRHGYLQVSRRA